jgi:F0F1-type ATP synthase assembly protein I
MKSKPRPLGGLDLVFQLTVLLLVMTIGPLVLGLWIDRSANTSPFATLCLILIGVFGGTIAMYRIITDAYKRIGGQNR